MNTRITTSLLALLLFLFGTTSALAAPSNRVAGLEATIHGAAQLQLSSCLHPDTSGGALFLAFIDNHSADPVQNYRITLHGVDGALLAERTFTALQPGDSDVFAVRIDASQATVHDGGTQCDDGR